MYISTNHSPKFEARDMSVDQIFSAQVNGTKCKMYRVMIFNNSTNEKLYDTSGITLTETLYDKDILNHTVPANTVTNGLRLKWVISMGEEISLLNVMGVSSGEIFFTSSGIPTVSLTPPVTITSHSYEFSSTYDHPNFTYPKQYKYILYDNNDKVIDESEYIYSSKLKYAFDGFFNTNTYKIECIVIDQNNVTTTSGKKTFNVSYSQPNLIIVPDAIALEDKSAVSIKIGKVVQTVGVPFGAITFVNNFIRANNKGAQLINTATPTSITYPVNITMQTTTKFKYKFADGFTGIFYGQGENDEYKVGYDGTKFYFNNKGSVCFSEPIALPSEPIYIVVRPTDVFINGIRLGF